VRVLWLVLLAGCTSMTDTEREYARADAYHKYMDRKSACRGIWVTNGFEHKDAHRQSAVTLRQAGCVRKL
jgi:hypothetical protein